MVAIELKERIALDTERKISLIALVGCVSKSVILELRVGVDGGGVL